jgi:predicted RNase H-like nuclease (RuvC/YqgF family)
MAESMEERLRQFMESMSQKVDSLDWKVDAMRQKGNVLEGKMDGMEQKVDVLEQKVTGVERMTSHMEQSYYHIATTMSQGQMVFRQGIEQLRMELHHQKERLEYQGTIQHVQNSNPFQSTSGIRLPRRPPL